MNPWDATFERPCQKIVSAHRHRHIAAPGQMQQVERVARGLRSIDIATDRANPDQIDLWRGQQIGKRHRIIDAGVAIEVNRTAHAFGDHAQSPVRWAMKKLATKAASVMQQEIVSALVKPAPVPAGKPNRSTIQSIATFSIVAVAGVTSCMTTF